MGDWGYCLLVIAELKSPTGILDRQLPFGGRCDFSDKLINRGENRFSFRPQVRVIHERGKWSFEFTGATWFFTENDDFFGGKEVEQDPLVTLQGHVIHTFRPGLWLGASLGYIDQSSRRQTGSDLGHFVAAVSVMW